MQPVRILIVDDSAVVRKVLNSLLASDPEIVVAGTAGNGSQALARIPEAKPDLVTLDIEMPGMDGLETLVEIRKLYPKLPVIMFSTLTERGATATLDALARGASDYVTKPSQGETREVSQARVREELIRKIKSLCAVRVPRAQPPPPSAPTPTLASARPQARIDVVAIGASTGGPNALTALIPQFPADFPVPIVIVQHMPPLFTRFLAERLQSGTELRVEEAADGAPVVAGTVLIAPGDYHMRVRSHNGETIVRLDQAPPENSCRPSVDVLFRSVAETYGGAAISAILTGMGQDGLRGAEVLKANGAYVIAQDEATSVVWGMPGAVAGAGLANCVLPLDAVVPEILRQVGKG